MFGRTEQATTKNRKGEGMPKTGARRRPLERTQKAKKVRPSAPLLETRARTILETMVEEVADAAPAGLTLPEVPEPILAAPEPASAEVQSIDELATRDLVTIVKNGGSLEVDGSRYTSDELELLAENVTQQAHLKINNSGSFSAKELAAIAQTGPGQVIFA
jgi:hypothetical protein